MPGKKLNNKKNYSGREAWMKRKKENRPKQTWVLDDTQDIRKAVNILKFVPIHV
jgi:hypothetical protein